MTDLEKLKLQAFELMREMGTLQNQFKQKDDSLKQIQKQIEELESLDKKNEDIIQ